MAGMQDGKDRDRQKIWPIGLYGGDSGTVFGKYLNAKFSPNISTASGLVSSGVLALGLRKFLSDKMGDVEAWATYEEADLKYQNATGFCRFAAVLCGMFWPIRNADG